MPLTVDLVDTSTKVTTVSHNSDAAGVEFNERSETFSLGALAGIDAAILEA